MTQDAEHGLTTVAQLEHLVSSLLMTDVLFINVFTNDAKGIPGI